MERDTSWDEPQLSDGDNSSIKKQREELIKKWEATGLLDDLKSTNKTNIAELMESEASVLLKKEILNMDELNDYLRMLADMKNIGIRRKLVLLEGFINKVRREIEHQNGRYKNSSPEE
jgi:hypothetical protein